MLPLYLKPPSTIPSTIFIYIYVEKKAALPNWCVDKHTKKKGITHVVTQVYCHMCVYVCVYVCVQVVTHVYCPTDRQVTLVYIYIREDTYIYVLTYVYIKNII
eukprot:GHVR01018329.1.p1 GENE.GHVR01018329.1~~GHVR01018329.1.p1  ORF type:complete len:103 (-),score=23.93 GHVR01018329.1:101-409(-)